MALLSEYLTKHLQDITVTVGDEERYRLDYGRPVSKPIFQNCIGMIQSFIQNEAFPDRTYNARTLFGESHWRESRFRYHASRTLAYLVDQEELPLYCINPNVKGTKLYMLKSTYCRQAH